MKFLTKLELISEMIVFFILYIFNPYCIINICKFVNAEDEYERLFDIC